MEPGNRTEYWQGQWWPMPVSGEGKPDAPRRGTRRRTGRGAARRARAEANRTMLEMLRALAQSEADSVPELNPHLDGDSEGTTAGELAASPVEIPRDPAAPGHEAAAMSGLMLLRATILGPEPDDTELHCRYCNRVFRLQEGGASFEGNAACSDCEQRLNQDLVLPAVSRHRPHIYQVCEVAEGPDRPKRPAWARKRLPENLPHASPTEPGEDEDIELVPLPAEDLQEA